MWKNSLRAYVAKVVYDVWMDQGQPQTVAARDVLERYRQAIGDITPKILGEVLAVMEDDSGTMPFLRVSIQNMGGEMGELGLKDINATRLLILASGTAS